MLLLQGTVSSPAFAAFLVASLVLAVTPGPGMFSPAGFVRDAFLATLSRLAAAADGPLGALIDRLDDAALEASSGEARRLHGTRQASLRALRRDVSHHEQH